jgi:hypothetical protein
VRCAAGRPGGRRESIFGALRWLPSGTPGSICIESGFHPACYPVVGCVSIPDAVVGSGAMILAGVRLGADRVVGASAVTPKSFDAYSIVAGNPTVVVGRIDQSEIR